MPDAPTDPGAPLLVACLCAQWCRTCDAYRDTLAAVQATIAATHPAARLRVRWVDIEDEADTIGDLDIEDFPTLLIARDDDILFFGPVLPHAQTLQRHVERALAGEVATPAAGLPADVRALPRVLAPA